MPGYFWGGGYVRPFGGGGRLTIAMIFRASNVHQRLNGAESQQTPFSKLLLELLDTQVFSGSVKRGSVRWRFLGKWQTCWEVIWMLNQK